MSSAAAALLGVLADGAIHAGHELAERVAASRGGVAPLVRELRGRGVPVASVRGRGYRLPEPVELLDARQIADAASSRGRSLPVPVEVLFEIGSTNTYLFDSAPGRPGDPRIVFAELQHAGRGRRGRSWTAPFGSGLTFSLAWTFAATPPGLAALGLALGVAVAESLRGLGVTGAGLKWPNDIVWRERKLGGLLLQMRTESTGLATVVAGLGLNLRLPRAARDTLAAGGAVPVADLAEAMQGALPGRNELAAVLASDLLAALAEFERSGFSSFRSRWGALDALVGASVRVSQGSSQVEGRACGVDDDGALRVAVDGTVQSFHSGDVSVRRARP